MIWHSLIPNIHERTCSLLVGRPWLQSLHLRPLHPTSGVSEQIFFVLLSIHFLSHWEPRGQYLALFCLCGMVLQASEFCTFLGKSEMTEDFLNNKYAPGPYRVVKKPMYEPSTTIVKLGHWSLIHHL